MVKTAFLLAKPELINLFGLNEARYSRDKKKKRRLILLFSLYCLIIVMMMGYIVLMSCGLASVGLGDVIVPIITTIISLITFVFTFIKAQGALFDLNAYERLIALPVSPTAIVVSRFLVMYITNLALSMLAALPAFGVYAWYMKPYWPAYVMFIFGQAVIPLIPMAMAGVLGAVIAGIASRMRRKSLVGTLLAIVVTVAAVALPVFIPMDIDVYELSRLSRLFTSLITRLYPPAGWFSTGVLAGDWGSFCLFAIASIGVFAAFAALVQWKYAAICRATRAHASRGNFTLTRQKRSSPLLALYKKEMGRYFASTIYVVNTSIGYVMMLVGSIAISWAGVGAIDAIIPGVMIARFLPLVVSMMCALTATTSSSISLEGRSWWIAQTLPVSAKTIFDAKILVQLTIALPFYIISCLILTFTFAMSATTLVCLWVAPVCYMLYSAVTGLAINVKMPVFNWDSETLVVKQSAAVGFSMLISMAGILPAAALAIFFPEHAGALTFALCIAILAVSFAVYRRTCAVRLSGVG